jgi:hypothetical protein
VKTFLIVMQRDAAARRVRIGLAEAESYEALLAAIDVAPGDRDDDGAVNALVHYAYEDDVADATIYEVTDCNFDYAALRGKIAANMAAEDK